jgi:hypothetical protein
MKLTDTACKNAKPAEKTFKMADKGGMYLKFCLMDQNYGGLNTGYTERKSESRQALIRKLHWQKPEKNGKKQKTYQGRS